MYSINVKSLNGIDSVVPIENEDDKISDLKKLIFAHNSVPVERQRLIYHGRVLKDDENLRDLQLEGKTIHLVDRPPPSANSQTGSIPSHDEQPQPTTTAPTGNNHIFNHGALLNMVNMVTRDLFGRALIPNFNGTGQAGQPLNLATAFATLSTMNSQSQRLLRRLDAIKSAEESAPETVPQPSTSADPPQENKSNLDKLADSLAEQVKVLERTLEHMKSAEEMVRAEALVQKNLEASESQENTSDLAWDPNYFQNLSHLLHVNSHTLHLISELDVAPTPVSTDNEASRQPPQPVPPPPAASSRTGVENADQKDDPKSESSPMESDDAKVERTPKRDVTLNCAIPQQTTATVTTGDNRNQRLTRFRSALPFVLPQQQTNEPRSRSQGPPLSNENLTASSATATATTATSNMHATLFPSLLTISSQLPITVNMTQSRPTTRIARPSDQNRQETQRPYRQPGLFNQRRSFSANRVANETTTTPETTANQAEGGQIDPFLLCRSRHNPRVNGIFQGAGLIPTNMEVFLVAERPVILSSHTSQSQPSSQTPSTETVNSRQGEDESTPLLGNQQASNDSTNPPNFDMYPVSDFLRFDDIGNSIMSFLNMRGPTANSAPAPNPSQQITVQTHPSELIWLPRLILDAATRTVNQRMSLESQTSLDRSAMLETGIDRPLLNFLHELFDFISPALAYTNSSNIVFLNPILNALENRSNDIRIDSLMNFIFNNQLTDVVRAEDSTSNEAIIDVRSTLSNFIRSSITNLLTWIRRSPTHRGFNAIISFQLRELFCELFTLIDCITEVYMRKNSIKSDSNGTQSVSESRRSIFGLENSFAAFTEYIEEFYKSLSETSRDRAGLENILSWFNSVISHYNGLPESRISYYRMKYIERIKFQKRDSDTTAHRERMDNGRQSTWQLPPWSNDNDMDLISSLSSNIGNYLVRSSERSTEMEGERIPESWVELIRQDEAISSNPLSIARPITSLSDAYISGMPAKRRKIIQEQKENMIFRKQDIFYEILNDTLNLDDTRETRRESPTELSLIDSFHDVFVDRVANRLKEDTDFNSDRYPKANSTFNNKKK